MKLWFDKERERGREKHYTSAERRRRRGRHSSTFPAVPSCVTAEC